MPIFKSCAVVLPKLCCKLSDSHQVLSKFSWRQAFPNEVEARAEFERQPNEIRPRTVAYSRWVKLRIRAWLAMALLLALASFGSPAARFSLPRVGASIVCVDRSERSQSEVSEPREQRTAWQSPARRRPTGSWKYFWFFRSPANRFRSTEIFWVPKPCRVRLGSRKFLS